MSELAVQDDSVMPHDYSNLPFGTKVQVKVNGVLTEGTFRGMDTKYNMPSVQLSDGRKAPRKIYGVINGTVNGSNGHVGHQPIVVADDSTEAETVPAAPVWPINTRFKFLSQMVRMVVTGDATSLVITGDGGLGKSFTVFKTLSEIELRDGEGRSLGHLEEDVNYVVIKGFSTPKSLYRTLYEHREKVIIFDDCDSVLKNDTAVNILKAALDTTSRRTVSWVTERSGGESEDSLPTKFDFIGRVIFISNRKLDEIPQPLLSRAIYVDVCMTAEEKLERMEGIAPQLAPHIPLEVKLETIAFMRTMVDRIKDLNIRSLLKALNIRTSSPEDWKDIAAYVLTTGHES